MQFKTKLGRVKGQERSRIWIEGNRLSAHGFEVGTRFVKRWFPDNMLLVLRAVPHEATKMYKHTDLGLVSGKGDKPIIDIVGTKVRDTFTGTHVIAEFDRNVITVRGSNEGSDSL